MLLEINTTEPMNREQRLRFCEKCTLRNFSAQKGIVCSLTNEHADFNGICPNYNEDERAARLVEEENSARAANEMKDDTLGFSLVGIKNGIVAGTVVILLAIIWFVVGITMMNRIFFYPAFLVIIGGIAINKGIKKKKESSRKGKGDLLDDF